MATTDPKKDIKDVNLELGYIEDQLLSIADRLSGSIKDAMRDIKDEALGVSNIFKNNLSRSIRDIAKGSDAILGNTLKLAQGTAKISDIQKAQYTLQLKELTARRNITSLINAQLLEEKEIDKVQREITEAIAGQNKLLQDQLEYAEKIQKNLGVTGGILKGIAKIPVLGNFIDAEAALAAAQRTAAQDGATRAKVMSSAFKQLGSSLKTNLSDPLVSIGIAYKLFQALYRVGAEFSARTFEIQKTLGLSTASAKAMNEEFYSMQQSTDNIYANYKDLVKANFNLNEALGTSATFSADVLATQAKLMEVTGLTAEESAKVYEFSLLTGQSQEQVYNSVGKTNKGVLSNKKVLQEVLKTSGQLAAQYKNNPELLGKAVVQVQKLGINLEQAKKMAGGLLNFEDSISSELEAELLTGQELNLEKARTLALQGKTAEAASEMLRQTGGLAKFQSMNVLQQDALAKSMGMSTDELADSLVKAQQLEKLGASERRILDEKVSALKKAGEFEKASQLEKLALQGKSVELAAQELDTQAQIDKSVSSIKESLKSAVAGPLGDVTKYLSGVLKDMAANPVMKAMLGGVGMVAAAGAAGAAAAAAVMAIKNMLFGSAIDRKQLKQLEQINSNTSGGGISSGAGGDDDSGGSSTGGGLGSSLKGAVKGFKSGGFKGGLKNLGGMAKSGLKGLGKGGLKGIGKGLLRKIPMLGALIGGGMEIAEGGFNVESLSRAALSGGGAALGGLLGGIGGLGAASVPLGIAGGIGGSMAGDYLGDKIFGERPESAEDFIIRPGQKPLKFRKDDIIMGGTSLTGNSNGGNGGGNVEALLQELIAAVKQGGNIHIGANKLNEAIGINLHPMR